MPCRSSSTGRRSIAGLTNSVRDNDERFPPEWRLSQRGRAAE